MKIKYFHHELARDVACGKPMHYLLVKYKAFKVGKQTLKKLFENPEFMAMVDEINSKINDKVADTRKRLQLLSDKALDVIENVLNDEKQSLAKINIASDVLKMAGIPMKDKEVEIKPITIKLEKAGKEEEK